MTVASHSELIEQIQQLGPWHLDIQLTEELSTGSAYELTEWSRDKNQGVALISPRDGFVRRVQSIFGDLSDKTFLDCACNAGGYCFWARELNCQRAVGFDVRKHWIDQARFVGQHRTVAPVDRIEFHEMDMYDLDKLGLKPFDLVLFKGIFYHLPEPLRALKMVADLTTEVLWFNSATYDDDDGNSLFCTFENPSPVMSGVHTLSWLPTGPTVVGKMLYWAGFRDIRMTMYKKTSETEPRRGRIEVIAAKTPGFLDGMGQGEEVKILRPERSIGWAAS